MATALASGPWSHDELQRVSHLESSVALYALDLTVHGVHIDTAVHLFAFVEDPRRTYRRFFKVREAFPDNSPEYWAAVCWMESRSDVDAIKMLREMGKPRNEVRMSSLKPQELRRLDLYAVAPEDPFADERPFYVVKPS